MDYKEKVITLLKSQELSKEQKEKLENIFPELKESEDERIRKVLLNDFKNNCSEYYCEGVNRDMIIAWLEKQGEIIKEWSEMKINNIHTELQEMVDLKHKTEQGEQKPADKVKSKFKIEDWVVYRENTWKIGNISLQNYYELLKTNNEVATRSIKEVDENAHLWIIQDAKDGDVLANDHHILILRELGYSWAANGNPDSLYAYCGIKPNGNFELEQKGYCFCGTLHTHPATKEQRDQLEKAMADAGYTFDFEKKELKKIEQKPTYTKEYNFHGIKFVPNFKKGDLIREKLSGRILTIKDFSYDTGLYTYDTGQFPITIQNQYELVEQKPAWSEEDEKIIRRIDSLLYSQCKIHGSEYEEIHNWLKSLRPQNTWKPSDEQIKALKETCDADWEPV